MKRVFKNLDVCELIGFAVLGGLCAAAFVCCVINSIVTL